MIVRLKPGQPFFAQGEAALFVFYLQVGSAKLTVISERGKEATIMLLKAGDFIGEETPRWVECRVLGSAVEMSQISLDSLLSLGLQDAVLLPSLDTSMNL